MGMQVDKKDLAEKIIEAEIQKTGDTLERHILKNHMQESSSVEMSEENQQVMDQEKLERQEMSEEEQAELQELLRKRKAYQEELKSEEEAYRKEEAARKNRRYSSIVKVAVLVLVASGCLFAFSMRSEATRMWWLTSVERVVGKDRETKVNNDENRIISDTTVKEAIAEIEEKTGIPMPEFYYQPVGLKFDGYDYDEVSLRGHLQYVYEECTMHIYAFSSEEDTSYASIFHGEKLSEEIIKTEYADVKVMEFKQENDRSSTIVAEWIYHNHQYQLYGKVPLEEIKLILENILY